jgi:hypothetical protein
VTLPGRLISQDCGPAAAVCQSIGVNGWFIERGEMFRYV